MGGRDRQSRSMSPGRAYAAALVRSVAASFAQGLKAAEPAEAISFDLACKQVGRSGQGRQVQLPQLGRLQAAILACLVVLLLCLCLLSRSFARSHPTDCFLLSTHAACCLRQQAVRADPSGARPGMLPHAPTIVRTWYQHCSSAAVTELGLCATLPQAHVCDLDQPLARA